MRAIRRLLLTGIGAGLLAALVVSLVQALTTTPLILEAERYELGAAAAGRGDHVPAPAEVEVGLSRVAGTVGANLVAGAGFGLLLVAAFALRGERPDPRRGILWGLGGFVAFALAPSLGLPPELPGSVSAALPARQLWWLATVVVTTIGLWTAAFGGRSAWLALALLPLPHLVGAPRAEGFGGEVPPELAAHFVAASLVTAAIFWATLGGAAAWFGIRLERS
jgi:cobalt transporter subunit CbtA